MLYDIPKLADGLRLSSEMSAQASAPLMYALHVGDERRVRLPAQAVYLLMLADGRATIQNLYQRARRLGMTPPDDFIEQLFAALYQVGFAAPLDLSDVEHTILPATEHTCEGCGRSCEGHLVGPLARSEVETIVGHKEALEKRTPRLQGVRLLVKLPERDGVYLNLRDGRCVFLDDDRLCALHRHFGADSKPAICRTFPVVRVTTEDTVRIGVNNACFRQHVQGARSLGPPTKGRLEAGLGQIPRIAAYHAPFDAFPLVVPDATDAGRRERFVDTEAQALAYLGRADGSISGFVKLVLGRTLDTSPATSLVTGEVFGHVQAAVARLLENADLDRSFLGFLRTVEGGLADTYRAYIPKLQGFLATEQEGALPFTRDDEVFLLDHLRRLLWLREALRFATPHHAFACFVVGWVVCLTLNKDAGEQRANHVGEDFTAWYRLLTEDNLHRHVFASTEEAVALLRGFLAGQRPDAG